MANALIKLGYFGHYQTSISSRISILFGLFIIKVIHCFYINLVVKPRKAYDFIFNLMRNFLSCNSKGLITIVIGL